MKVFVVFLFLMFGFSSVAQVTKVDNRIVLEGKSAFEAYACNNCHGNKGDNLGDFSGLKKRFSDEEIIRYIKNPRLYGNKLMPVYDGVIPSDKLNTLVHYLHHLGSEQTPKKL